MKINHPIINKAILLTAIALELSLCCGCDSLKPNLKGISATDTINSSEVSSQLSISAEEAVSIYVGEIKLDDCFLMNSLWDGKDYQNENSLNQLMTVEYMSADSVIPQAQNATVVTFKFAGDEKPESVKLTQQANTFKVNTGIPYDIIEVKLSQNQDGDYYFAVDFDSYPMYYYMLDCEWINGNKAQYAFALERVK